MATKTKAQVRDRVASILKRRAQGGAIDPNISARIDEAWDAVFDDLKDEQLAIWAIAGPLPKASLLPPVADLMAFDCSGDIHVSAALQNKINLRLVRAKPAIRRIVTPTFRSVTEPEDF